MTTLIAIGAVLLAVVLTLLALLVLVGLRIMSRNTVDAEDYDYCDTCASEPAPLQGTEIDEAYKQRRHVKAHQPWGAIND